MKGERLHDQRTLCKIRIGVKPFDFTKIFGGIIALAPQTSPSDCAGGVSGFV